MVQNIIGSRTLTFILARDRAYWVLTLATGPPVRVRTGVTKLTASWVVWMTEALSLSVMVTVMVFRPSGDSASSRYWWLTPAKPSTLGPRFNVVLAELSPQSMTTV